ncbi:S8 family serine peptidase [Cupriavidus sp. L7L]|uniref:S8 family serine peptidase n=1 Tax=Cupriavidus sp. L7L TaxID=2546443 RepID=UPI001404F52C|nr:S8 family serine peptidase [Cupriavidus sp. L7L]
MDYLALLRVVASGGAPVQQSVEQSFPSQELRFVLEYSAKPDIEAQAEEVRKYVGNNFCLQPLGNAGALDRFLALRFPGVERTLPPRELFAMAYALADALGLESVEPELGTDVYADPKEETGDPAIEAAAVAGLCWVNGTPPANRLWALDKTGVTAAWPQTKGAGILIAHADTGIAAHDELDSAHLDMGKAFDILDGDSNPEDPLSTGSANPGHGTGTLSVILGRTTSAMSGVAPDATAVPIRCIEDVKVFNPAPVAAAIAHATQVGCHVISMSLGGVPSHALHAAVREAVASDMIVIAAAGNCVRTVVWPARYDEVIAVAGINIEDRPWKGSCRGDAVDISGPAEFVWRAQRNSPADPTSKIGAGQGTSFAAALLAGVAALWLSHHGRDAVICEARARGVSVQRLFRAALRATARQPQEWDADNFGPGVVDAPALVALQLSNIPTASPESTAVPAASVKGLLEEAFGAAVEDATFSWPRYEMEVAAIALSQAKFGASISELKRESKTLETRPSPQLSVAAKQSADARLQNFAERSGSSSVSKPLALTPIQAKLERIRIAIPQSIVVENAGAFDFEATRQNLAGLGKVAQLDRAATTVDSIKGLGLHGRNELMGSVEVAIDQIAQGKNFTHEGLLGLEALVRLTGRPALRVRSNTVDLKDPQAKEWESKLFFAMQRGQLGQCLAAIGRIDIGGVHVGTGFVVGEDIVLTNRHVLQAFAAPIPRRNNPQQWVMTADNVTIDFSDEPSSLTTKTRFQVLSVIGAGPDEIRDDAVNFACLDAALLQVKTVNDEGGELPAPLSLLEKSTLSDLHRPVFVVGYPAEPSALPRDAAGEIDVLIAGRLLELFGAEYGTKYLSPGEVILKEKQSARDPHGWVFAHDSTTLPGSSGSAAVSHLDPTGVVGLHFGGQWMRENYAHALSAIKIQGGFLVNGQLRWRP